MSRHSSSRCTCFITSAGVLTHVPEGPLLMYAAGVAAPRKLSELYLPKLCAVPGEKPQLAFEYTPLTAYEQESDQLLSKRLVATCLFSGNV